MLDQDSYLMYGLLGTIKAFQEKQELQAWEAKSKAGSKG